MLLFLQPHSYRQPLLLLLYVPPLPVAVDFSLALRVSCPPKLGRPPLHVMTFPPGSFPLPAFLRVLLFLSTWTCPWMSFPGNAPFPCSLLSAATRSFLPPVHPSTSPDQAEISKFLKVSQFAENDSFTSRARRS